MAILRIPDGQGGYVAVPAIKGDDGKPGTTMWSGLTDKPTVFPPASHTHTLADISNAPNSHTSAQTASTLMSRDSAGRARVNNPSNSLDIANKSYVDGADATLRARVDSRPAVFSGDGPPPANIPGAGVGDWYVDRTTSEWHIITGL